MREPARAFIRAMQPHLDELCPAFIADDRKVGGSLMRVFRDTRFSKDKTPYKTNVGVQFRHEDGEDVHAPGIYVHLSTGGCFLGVGSWMPLAEPLRSIRNALVADPDRATAALTLATAAGFAVGGHGSEAALKRVPAGFPPDHPLADRLRQKSHILTVDLPRAVVLRPDLDREVAERLRPAIAYLRWLTEAVGARF